MQVCNMKNLNLVGKSGTRMKVITIGATGFIGRYAVTKLIEAGHKRRVNASLGFRSFDGAQRTIQGYEAMHMIRKVVKEGRCCRPNPVCESRVRCSCLG